MTTVKGLKPEHTINWSQRTKRKTVKMEITDLIMFFLLCQVVGVAGVNDEIFTFQKGDRVTCVTQNTESPIFITPPDYESSKFESTIVENGIWTKNDWLTKDANKSAPGPVTDKRWEYFETSYGNFQYFNALPISVSVYATAYTEFNLDDNPTLESPTVNHNTTEEWVHFHIFTENQTTFIMENNRILYYKTQFEPKSVFIVTPTDTYWKKHDYQFKWANTTTKEEPTTLTVFSPPEKKCLIVYMFLCPACFLTISIEDIEDTVFGLNDNLVLSWQYREITFETNKENTLSFYRGKSNEDDEVGEWGIDVRWCPNVDSHDKVIYEAHLKVTKENKVCHLLENQHTKNSKETTKDKPFRCEPGMLGKHCSVNCEDVLGSEHCEEYRLCESTTCKCAWGYKEPSCQERCSRGSWGLSCENACKECEQCDIFTGQCSTEKEDKSSSVISVVPEWSIPSLILFSLYVAYV